MADRTVKVTLTAAVAGYIQGMQAAQAATIKVDTQAQKLAAQRKSVETLAKAGVALGGAIVGVGIAALKTGIQYNTLQQKARAALTTLLGSAKAANAQMDKLDAFAKTSPFAKQVFITAQQQLVGFGVSAKKVIPILDAVQNAVAAIGGSNQDITDIVNVIAKIQAEGKVTARTLLELGTHGIDAATLMGKAMGKTGKQIREDITAGTLGAGEAIDALVKGMDGRFKGAAANVKNTMSGALDRVKAAWRDFSSSLATPLVNPHGGGLLIDLLNQAATVMRAYIALPEPIKMTAAAGIGLVGVVTLLGSAAVLALPKLVAFRVAVATLQQTSPLAARGIGAVTMSVKLLGAAAAGVGVGIGILGGLSAALKATAINATDLSNEITSATKARQLFNAAGKEGIGKPDNISFAAAEVKILGKALEFAAGQGQKSNPILAGVAVNAQRIGAEFAKLVASDMPQAVKQFKMLSDEAHLTSEQQQFFIARSPEFKKALTDQATALHIPATNANLLKIALGQVEQKTKDVSDAQSKAVKSAVQYSAAAEDAGLSTADATKEIADWVKAVSAADAGFIDLQGAYDAIVQKNKDIAQSTADATKSSKDSWQTYYNGVTVSVGQYLADLEKQVRAQQNWQTNMVMLSGRVSAGTITELAKLGQKGAPLVAQLVNASDAELARLDGVMRNRAGAATNTFATTLDKSKPIIEAAAAQLGKAGAQKVAAELAKGDKSVEQIIKQYGLKIRNNPLPITAETSSAKATIDQFVRRESSRTISVRLVAQAQPNLAPGLGKLLGPARSRGGILPGAPSRKDSMWVHAAPGEYIVNAEQTARHRALLEQINRGGLPGYADGGYVKPRYASTAPAVSVPTVNASVALPSTLVVVDTDGHLITTMQVVARDEAARVQRAVNVPVGGRR